MLFLIVISFYIPSAKGVSFPLEESPVIDKWSQEKGRSFPLESLNVVTDVIDDLLANETDEELRYALKSLRMQMEEKILSENLSIPQIIDSLKRYVSRKKRNIYMKNASVRVMDKLIEKYPVSDPEISKIVNMLLRGLASRGEFNHYIYIPYLQFLNGILESFVLPEEKVLQIFDRGVKRHLFHANVSVREGAIQVTKKLLGKASDKEKREIIFWIANYLTGDLHFSIKLFALEALGELLKHNFLPDLDDRRTVTFMVKDRISDEGWEVSKTAIEIVTDLLNREDISLDSHERRQIISMIVKRISSEHRRVKQIAITSIGVLLNQVGVLFNPQERREIVFMILDYGVSSLNRGVQKRAIVTLDKLLGQENFLVDPNDRKEIAISLLERPFYKNWKVQIEAMKTLNVLLGEQDHLFDSGEINRIIFTLPKWFSCKRWEVKREILYISGKVLSHKEVLYSEKLKIAYYLIAQLIFHDDLLIRTQASEIIARLWSSDFPYPEKVKIRDFLVGEIVHNETPVGKTEALNALQEAIKQEDLSLEFDVIYYMRNMISDPSSLGKAVEAFVEEYLTGNASLTPTENTLMRMEIQEQLSIRNATPQENPVQMTVCEESMVPVVNAK